MSCHVMLHFFTLHYTPVELREISQYTACHDMQAQHNTEAAQIAQAVRAAACLPLLALAPAHRTPQRLTLLSHLTNSLQVCV